MKRDDAFCTSNGGAPDLHVNAPPRTRKQTHSQSAHKHALKHTHAELDTHPSMHTRTLTRNEAHSHQLARARVTDGLGRAARRTTRPSQPWLPYGACSRLEWCTPAAAVRCMLHCLRQPTASPRRACVAQEVHSQPWSPSPTCSRSGRKQHIRTLQRTTSTLRRMLSTLQSTSSTGTPVPQLPPAAS